MEKNLLGGSQNDSHFGNPLIADTLDSAPDCTLTSPFMAVSCIFAYSRFQVGCPKIATRIHACAKFPIQNSRPSARMRRFSSRFLDNQLEIDCSVFLAILEWTVKPLG